MFFQPENTFAAAIAATLAAAPTPSFYSYGGGSRGGCGAHQTAPESEPGGRQAVHCLNQRPRAAHSRRHRQEDASRGIVMCFVTSLGGQPSLFSSLPQHQQTPTAERGFAALQSNLGGGAGKLGRAMIIQQGKGNLLRPLVPPIASPAPPTASPIGATRGKKRKTAGSSSGRRGTFQTSGGGLGLLTPASSAKKTLLGV